MMALTPSPATAASVDSRRRGSEEEEDLHDSSRRISRSFKLRRGRRAAVEEPDDTETVVVRPKHESILNPMMSYEALIGESKPGYTSKSKRSR